ncbi:MAG: MaoC domain protein dehydratase [Frankiales bacterium]|nr:MaoC domain protein dehydratase [Frankiales bacterium]
MAGDLLGQTVDRVQFRVERGKVLELARATRATDPRHVDAGAATADGHPDSLATATHVVVAGHHRDQQAFVAALGLELRRIVVGSVSWSYERPLVVGDDLVGTRRVVGDETREGRRGTNRVVTLETDFVDATGAVAVRQREVLIERGTP